MEDPVSFEQDGWLSRPRPSDHMSSDSIRTRLAFTRPSMPASPTTIAGATFAAQVQGAAASHVSDPYVPNWSCLWSAVLLMATLVVLLESLHYLLCQHHKPRAFCISVCGRVGRFLLGIPLYPQVSALLVLALLVSGVAMTSMLLFSREPLRSLGSVIWYLWCIPCSQFALSARLIRTRLWGEYCPNHCSGSFTKNTNLLNVEFRCGSTSCRTTVFTRITCYRQHLSLTGTLGIHVGCLLCLVWVARKCCHFLYHRLAL